MRLFSRINIAARLAVGFAVVTALALALGVFAIRSVGTVSDLTTKLYEHPFIVTNSLHFARSEYRAVQRDVRDTLLATDRAQVDTLVAGMDSRYQSAMGAIRTARQAYLGDKRRFDAVEAPLQAYQAMYREVGTLMRQGSREQATALVRGKGVEAAAAATRAFDPLIESAAERGAAFMVDAQATRDLVTNVNIGLLVMALVIAIAAAVLTAMSITRPLGSLRTVMGGLASGNLSVEVPCLERGDEIGAMAKTVDVFKHNAEEVERLRANQEAQKRRANEERQAALRKLAGDFESQVGSVVESVTAATVQLQASSSQMASNAAATSTEATSVASAAEEASTNSQTVASAAEQLSASITEIGSRVEHARSVAERADVEAAQSTERIRKLSDTVTSISTVVALINDIASQTNLLALNATIEAARAGDAGKGFAVVASEVKNLANQTAKATEEIGGQIGAVQSGTEDAVRAISGIAKVITEMGAISAAIAAAVEQQSAATSEISRNVEQAAAGTKEVSARITKVEAAARETGSAATQISAAATGLSSQAGSLRTEVGRFLEQVRADDGSSRLLVWDDSLSVGVPEIDRQHRAEIDRLNEFFAQMMQGEGQAAARRMAESMGVSMAKHFADEEELMRRRSYPGLAAQRQAHQAFLAEFKRYQLQIETDEQVDSTRFFNFIADWLRGHLRGLDRDLALFLHGKLAA